MCKPDHEMNHNNCAVRLDTRSIDEGDRLRPGWVYLVPLPLISDALCSWDEKVGGGAPVDHERWSLKCGRNCHFPPPLRVNAACVRRGLDRIIVGNPSPSDEKETFWNVHVLRRVVFEDAQAKARSSQQEVGTFDSDVGLSCHSFKKGPRDVGTPALHATQASNCKGCDRDTDGTRLKQGNLVARDGRQLRRYPSSGFVTHAGLRSSSVLGKNNCGLVAVEPSGYQKIQLFSPSAWR